MRGRGEGLITHKFHNFTLTTPRISNLALNWQSNKPHLFSLHRATIFPADFPSQRYMTVTHRSLNHSSRTRLSGCIRDMRIKRIPLPSKAFPNQWLCVRSMIKTSYLEFKRRKSYGFTCNSVTQFRTVTSCDTEPIQPL